MLVLKFFVALHAKTNVNVQNGYKSVRSDSTGNASAAMYGARKAWVKPRAKSQMTMTTDGDGRRRSARSGGRRANIQDSAKLNSVGLHRWPAWHEGQPIGDRQNGRDGKSAQGEQVPVASTDRRKSRRGREFSTLGILDTLNTRLARAGRVRTPRQGGCVVDGSSCVHPRRGPLGRCSAAFESGCSLRIDALLADFVGDTMTPAGAEIMNHA